MIPLLNLMESDLLNAFLSDQIRISGYASVNRWLDFEVNLTMLTVWNSLFDMTALMNRNAE